MLLTDEETEYINNHTPMKYICECGKEKEILLNTFIRGGRCVECGNRKKNEFKEVKNITKQQMQIFDGLMISDAFLRKTNGEHMNSCFNLTSSVKGFVDKVFEIFFNFPWSNKSLRVIDVYDKRTNKYYRSNRLRSLSTIFFTEQRKRWYPNGKKIIPKDIEIDKDMLLWWYIGDGFLCRKKVDLITGG